MAPKLHKAIIVPLLILLTLPLWAQSSEQLPNDPRITKGVMSNGLTYYLVKNTLQKGYADFYLAQRIGEISEDENQDGMSDIMYRLALRGTRSFPDQAIKDYFEDLGLNIGGDIVLENGFNNSLLGLKSVPISAKKEVTDTCLLFLYNVAYSINIDQDDVDAEIDNQIERLYSSREPQDRVNEKVTAELFPGGKYADLTAKNKAESIKQFTSRHLRSFYHQWYTADKQAIIVVGDIDVKSLESHIKSLFSTIPKSRNSLKDRVALIEDNDEPKVAIVYDKELTTASATITYLSNSIPEEYKNTGVGLVYDYMNDVACNLIKNRFNQRSLRAQFPIFDIDVNYGNYLNSDNKDALSITIETSPHNINEAMETIASEIGRLHTLGIGKDEYEKANKKYWQDLNNQYSNRISTSTNEYYSQMCIDNFFDNKSLTSIELKHLYLSKINVDDTLSFPQMNSYIATMIDPMSDVSIIYTLPEVGDSLFGEPFEKPTKEVIMWKFYENVNRTHTKYISTDVVDSSILSLPPKSGLISASRFDNSMATNIWELENGATVLFKKSKNEKNKLTLLALGKGGASHLGRSSNRYNIYYLNDVIANSSVGGYTPSDLDLLLSEKNIKLNSGVNLYSEYLKGEAPLQELDLFFKLVYNSFTQREGDIQSLSNYLRDKNIELSMRKNSPQLFFNDTITKITYNNSAYAPVQSLETFSGFEYKEALNFVNERFSNANNFVFVIVGDVEEERLKPLIERYIASLPSKYVKDNWNILPLYLNKRSENVEIDRDLEDPIRYVDMKYIVSLPYTASNDAHFNVTISLLREILNRNFSERGIKISVDGNMQFYPEEFGVLTIRYTCREVPENENITEEIKRLVSYISEHLDTKEIERVINKFNNQFTLTIADDNYWVKAIASRYFLGKDFHTSYINKLNIVTENSLREFLKQFNNGCLRCTVMK